MTELEPFSGSFLGHFCQLSAIVNEGVKRLFYCSTKVSCSCCQFSSTIGSAISDLSSEGSGPDRPLPAGWWSRQLGRKRQRGVVGETFKDKQAWATTRWWGLRKLIDWSAAAVATDRAREKKLPSFVQCNGGMSLRWWMVTKKWCFVAKRDQSFCSSCIEPRRARTLSHSCLQQCSFQHKKRW